MLKKLVVLTGSLMLMSCQENSKAKLQDLLEKKDFVNARVIVEERLGQSPQDNYYNGAMGYILSVECLSKNCPQNNPENLKKIKHYIDKSMGLAKVDDVYFVDFYQKIMKNVIAVALNQENLAKARLTLKDFINRSNPRINFIYKELFRTALEDILKEDFKKSSLDLSLLQEFDFKLTDEQTQSIDLLIALEKQIPLADLKAKIRAYNRLFISSKLPEEFLVLLAPVVVEYAVNNNVESAVDVLENSIKERSTLFGENVAVLRQSGNVKAYAKGVELVSKSENIISHLSEVYLQDESYFVNKLQNISLKLNSENKYLWAEYVLNMLKSSNAESLYENINIEQIPSTVIIANNDQLLNYADKVLEKQLVTDILNEVVFRDDANKDIYTKKTIELVEKALKFEISKNNLDGIFEYLNYVPAIKDKFKGELNTRLNEFINVAWVDNDFKNLDKLIDLHRDLNDISDNSILEGLFENYLLDENTQLMFKAENIKALISLSSENEDLNLDMAEKYGYAADNLKNSELQTILFSSARKMQGLYTQSKIFSYFVDAFDKEKSDDLIVDSVSDSLNEDTNKTLTDLVELADFLIEKANRLPEKFIADEIMPRFKSIGDITSAWGQSTVRTKEALVKYNSDIKNLIKVIENDKANKKITAATYIGKIKNKEILPFVEKYKKIYQSYVNQIVGFYIKGNGEKGPEIIKISTSEGLLKVNVDFISRLGKIENLDKYKLDRGEVISKEFNTYYNPVSSDVKLKNSFKAKELKVFEKAGKILLDGSHLALNGHKYTKVKELFVFNKSYGVVDQITEKTQDNFHILPEGSSFAITEELSKNMYKLELKHPAMKDVIVSNAKYNPLTAEFAFNYDYYIKLFDKTFSAKAKCQLIDSKAYCAVQDKYWKRQEYSVILKALQVK